MHTIEISRRRLLKGARLSSLAVPHGASAVPGLYLVHRDLPVKDLREFFTHAKKNAGKLNYGAAATAAPATWRWNN
ncbi:MAG TPA: hypothetical protein VEZ89_00295 [Rubrivivax sp.]|nr:hypothetical protein [Rubrivivax sp.]